MIFYRKYFICSYADLFYERASDFRKTMLGREEKIKNYKSGLLCLPKVERISKSIFYKDISEDTLKGENVGFAEYYRLEKSRCLQQGKV